VPIAALGAIAVAAAAAGCSCSLTSAGVALPWLVLPPVILLAVSQIHPLYDLRYVVFCLPAVALLASDGLGCLARFTARYTARLASGPAMAAAAWLPSLFVVVFIAAASVAPQQAVREPWSRPDYLRRVSKIVGRYARAGDAVLYILANSRIVSQGYPGPFRRLRDIALAESPAASDTLNGTEVDAAVLRSRFANVSRVWVISDNGRRLPAVQDALDIEKLALVGKMRMIGSWHTRNDLLLLFAQR
jgi:mannosyltransferase